MRTPLLDFPVCLQLRDRPVVVVGAGEVATRRIRSLLKAGARLTVVAPRASAEVEELAARGMLTWLPRAFQDADVGQALAVFAATDSRLTNRAVAEAARRARALVNAADDPAACDFTMPAVGESDGLTIAVSTGGLAPGRAGHIRDRLVQALDPRGLAPAASDIARGARGAGAPGAEGDEPPPCTPQEAA